MSRIGAAVGGGLGGVAGSIAGYYTGKAVRHGAFGYRRIDPQLVELGGAIVGAVIGAALGAGPNAPKLGTGVGEPPQIGSIAGEWSVR